MSVVMISIQKFPGQNTVAPVRHGRFSRALEAGGLSLRRRPLLGATNRASVVVCAGKHLTGTVCGTRHARGSVSDKSRKGGPYKGRTEGGFGRTDQTGAARDTMQS